MTTIMDWHNGQANHQAFEAEENYWARSRAADAERERACGHWDPEGAWEL